uniref:Low-density lipoprotein receptor-related protein 2-like n=1 Tax=Phallusia mammillata TaxID=59560 RepID=A0A6F9DK31_9ASCI|nr:low-density lipoprotein receptor-related protein 2-like [Phallusia mammillata]
MGLVLFTIAVKSLQYKGEYCRVDKLWRTSLGCTVLGVVTVLSSQASVFTLVVITSFRLFAVLKPLESKQLRLRTVVACLIGVWSLALFIAVFPLSIFLANSMVSRVWISANPYFPSDTVALKPYQEFSQRITALGNSSTIAPNDWYGIELYLQQNFPNSTPQVKGYFGYYSESGVCIPRLYQTSSVDAEPNPMTFAVMTINFLALVYIIMAYVAIYKRSTANTVTSTSSQAKTQELHRKITLLIATDMTCWFPLCFMSFLSMGGVILPPVAYALSAIVFLPINSSLNPIIYTNFFPFLWEWWIKTWSMVKAKLDLKTGAQPTD